MMEWLQNDWQALSEFWSGIDWGLWGVWSLTVCLLALGLIGAVVPFLPGPLLLFVAAILHTWLRPESAMSWPGMVLLTLLLVLAYFIDFASGVLGARWFGASRAGMVGVVIGGIVGLFFGLIGLILGPLIGGFAFEMLFARKTLRPAAKSTWGTLLGTGVGVVARVVISLVMIATFFLDALVW